MTKSSAWGALVSQRTRSGFWKGEGTLSGFLGAAFLMDEALGEFSGKGLHRLYFFCISPVMAGAAACEAPALISSRAAAQAKRVGKRMMIS